MCLDFTLGNPSPLFRLSLLRKLAIPVNPLEATLSPHGQSTSEGLLGSREQRVLGLSTSLAHLAGLMKLLVS